LLLDEEKSSRIDGDRFVKKRWPIVAGILVVVAVVLFVLSQNYPKPFPWAGILGGEWETSAYLGANIYNETVYGYSSLVFNVSSVAGSEVYMLSLNTTRLPMTSSSLIRTSVSPCKIDWGWLGLSNNYAFLTWNGTYWIADSDDGSEVPEITVINGYYPSAAWRKVGIEVASTSVKYYLDDQLVAMHTLRIPDGDFQFYGEFKSTGTASKLYIASHDS
jgi:hypothetical protein